MKLLTFCSLACACALTATSEMLPGYLTDPTSNWKELKPDGYQTPSHLKYPYVSMYYLRHTQTAGEKSKINYYVTDFDHSLCRFGDESKRFDVTLKLTSDGERFRVEEQRKVPSGNGSFDLGALPVGEYKVGVCCRDRSNGLASHTVWHEFRVVAKGALAIPPEKTRRMTEQDLTDFGIVRDPGYERLKLIEVPEDPAIHHKDNFYVRNKELAAMYLQFVDEYLAKNPHRDGATPGYAVYVPSWKGVALDRAYQRLRVVYDKAYDREKVAAEALANSDGLQRFVDEAWTNGFRKVVLLPGTYRVSHLRTLRVPDRTTLDLNGATLKLNGHVGQNALMVKIAAVTDAHLVNGTIEGDYWEHDYAAPESGQSEWVCGWGISAACRYCSVERVTARYITGYGGSNGAGTEGEGNLVRGKPFLTRCPGFGISDRNNPMVPGGLAADGSVDASDKAQWTSPYRDISDFRRWGYLTVSKMLGYQGVRTRGWNYVTAFYDADKKFISRETCFQYRNVLIPPQAKFARFSVEVANEDEARKNDLSVLLFKIPRNCTIAHCVYDRCRAVGHAASAMSNFLFQENEFRYCGESLATCAFDAEDGWDGMQDVLFLRNDFHDNNRSELLTCAGHNFQLVGNRARISLASRTFSPYVKGNVCRSAKFSGANRTRSGYARFIGNTFERSLTLGGEHTDFVDWDLVMSDLEFPAKGATNRLVITGGGTGRFRNCTFRNQEIRVPTAENCTFEQCQTGMMRWSNGRWKDCVAKGCTFTKNWSTNVFINCAFPDCHFQSLNKSPQKFVKCDLTGTKFDKRLDPQPEFVDCKGK